MVWDPGSGPRSGIRKKPIPDPGVRGQKGTGSRIPDPDPQHWSLTAICFNFFIFFHLEFLVLVQILSRLIQNASNHLIHRKMVCLCSGSPLFIQTTASKNCGNRTFYAWRTVESDLSSHKRSASIYEERFPYKPSSKEQ
jgi:hypothetical protein